MKKYGYKILAGLAILSVLAAAFWWGGNAPSLRGRKDAQTSDINNTLTAHIPAQPPVDISSERESQQQKDTSNNPLNEKEAENSDNKAPVTTKKEDSGGVETVSLDKPSAEPASDEKPVPESRKDEETADKQLTCTLSVRCDTILKNISWLKPEKVELIPEDGIIFAEQEVVFYEGESVFNVLLREMKKNKIHLEFENMPVYKSAYIEGINNIYEFDCGELSGWMYRVNGDFPNYGSSRYQLAPGDKVEWLYTCDLGSDIGGGSSFQGIRR
ncbi:MAG: DUF4430 domain-containing protein [Eubacteriales bacterium]|jgi:hypothetical protein|nr:DUF4430 domain-containing protein [Eubacteriales bacterium]